MASEYRAVRPFGKDHQFHFGEPERQKDRTATHRKPHRKNDAEGHDYRTGVTKHHDA